MCLPLASHPSAQPSTAPSQCVWGQREVERTQRPALSKVCPEGGRGVPGLGQAPAGGGCWGGGVPGLGRLPQERVLGRGRGLQSDPTRVTLGSLNEPGLQAPGTLHAGAAPRRASPKGRAGCGSGGQGGRVGVLSPPGSPSAGPAALGRGTWGRKRAASGSGAFAPTNGARSRPPVRTRRPPRPPPPGAGGDRESWARSSRLPRAAPPPPRERAPEAETRLVPPRERPSWRLRRRRPCDGFGGPSRGAVWLFRARAPLFRTLLRPRPRRA